MTAPSISDVLTATYNLVTLFDGREDEMRAWWAGTATGGYNADGTLSDGLTGHGGYYPMTNSAGVVIYFPCLDYLRSVMAKGHDAQTGLNFSIMGPWNTSELLEMVTAPTQMSVDPLKVKGICLNAPTANATLTISKIGTDGAITANWGTVTFYAGSRTSTFVNITNGSLLAGEALALYAPAAADATFMNFSIALPGVNS